ncbi:16S rRNA (guanine(966)-N(2))-methyltransferase RsmD, partial [bacterium]|nr:16S rRNA (guanine(966)-N(2))-methyltransferase RsmD [bacterium]
MRIAAGVLKGFPIVYPRNRAFRPTQEKVRAAVFNIIQDRLSGAEFLDLCCGTGAMGLEALSRGAQSITLVDMDVRYAGQ